MKHIALILTSLVASLAISSCSGDDRSNAPDDIRNNNSRLITICTNLPTYSSRGVMVDQAGDLNHCIVTIFNANNPHRQADDNSFNPWYLTELFKVNSSGGFTNAKVIWPEKDSPETGNDYGDQPLLFYAHYPDMGESLTPVNNSTYASSTDFNVDYALDGFTVDPDISKHIDFMTAFAQATIPVAGNDSRTVNLDFQHQLSAIEIKAKGEHTKYKIEIAGVMIGNIIDKGKFSFNPSVDAEGNVTSVGRWITNFWNEDFSELKKSLNPVKYIHKEDEEHVIPVKDSPGSIMGNGGNAMAIPFRSNAWDNKNDPKNDNKGTYFAVLVHVTDKDGNQAYPYPSKEQIPEGYQPGLRVAEKLNGIDYGWAAIPIKLNLMSGKRYSYILDFSKGIGVLPPDDPDPGKPIFAYDHIEISLSVHDWVEEELNITPDFGGGEQDGDQTGGDPEDGGDQTGGENEN